MKKRTITFLSTFLLILVISCNNTDDNEAFEKDTVETDELSIYDTPQDFIWKGLNLYYLWQDNVATLSDSRFKTEKEYESYLNSDTEPKSFFYNLLYDYPNSDKYSFIHEDYNVLDEQLSFNFNDSFALEETGIDFGLYYETDSNTNVFGYVRYVIPDSEASKTTIKRGDIFNSVNGIRLTGNNYYKLLFESNSLTLGLANLNNGNPISSGKSVSISKSQLVENPVFINKTFEINNSKVGYLMYNRFSSSFDDELNDAFGILKGEGISDLILDLRYNPGGSTNSALYLSSMITGQFKGELFSTEQWNSKAQKYYEQNYPENLRNKFTDNIPNVGAINSLNLNRVIVLTSRNSASASELVINSLSPYIDVVVIGDVTTGKVVGSITLYDSEDFSKTNINENHTYAMQPIVLEVRNKLGVNHPEGITPTVTLIENLNTLGVLGDQNEPLLKAGLEYIENGSVSFARNTVESREFNDRNGNSLSGNNMFKDNFKPLR